MKKLLIVLALLSTSCISLKQDQRKLHRISQRHPEVIVEKCAETFNPADSVHESIVYLPGITKYLDNFVEVNCDSVVKYVKDTKYYKVKCPPSKTIRDTILKEKYIKEVDKASVYLLNKTKDSLTKNIIKQEQKIKTKNKYLAILCSIFGILVLWTIFKNYIKTTLPI